MNQENVKLEVETSEVYKEWTDGAAIISKIEDKFNTVRVITEDEGTYRLLRFFKFKEWIVSCDIEAHEINEFLDKLLIKLNKEIN